MRDEGPTRAGGDPAARRAARAIADELERRGAPPGPLRVAIDGHGGSGKSTIADALAEMSQIAIVHTDDFFVAAGPRREGSSIEEYYDWRRLRAEALAPLGRGAKARFHATRWDGRGEDVVVEPAAVLVVEGVFAASPELCGPTTLRVLVETPEPERLERLRARIDATEWDDAWLAAESAYLERLVTRAPVDLVVSGSAERI